MVTITPGATPSHPMLYYPETVPIQLSSSTFGVARLTLREDGTRRATSLPLESSFRTVGLANPPLTSYAGSLRTRIVRVSSTSAGSSRGANRVRRHSTSATTRLSSGAERVRCQAGEGWALLGNEGVTPYSEQKDAFVAMALNLY